MYIDPEISKANTPAGRYYTDRQLFEKSKHLFAATWQIAGIARSDIPNGYVIPFKLMPGFLDEPLLLAKDKSGISRIISNVCTHRAAILQDKESSCSAIRCPYHGRRFGLDGKFEYAPEFEGVANFPAEADNLPSVSFRQFMGMNLCSISPHFSFEDLMAPVYSRLNWLKTENLRYKNSAEYTVHAHWALYVENYLEGLHIPYVHPGLSRQLDYAGYTTELFRLANLQIGLARDNDHYFGLPPESQDYGKKIAAYYYWLFPNIMLNFYPWGLSVNHVIPITPEYTRIEYHTFILDESKAGKGAGADLDSVEAEDDQIVESVQQGVKSLLYKQGRYSVTKETGTHHFHCLLQEFGAWS
jgi:choline monooxygenase